MKKSLAFILAGIMALSLAACGKANSEQTPAANEPTKAPTSAPAETSVVVPDNPVPTGPENGGDTVSVSTFIWDNFDDRDPSVKPDKAPNGASIWWDNWANLRAKNENGAVKLDYRPKAFDPEDYESQDDYFAHAADWMGNWGEAIDMWSLEGISYCKYLTIRVKGEAGGEEASLIMDWHPEDSRFYAARFSDLVLKDGSHPHITTDWQDLVIDLEASGFPGMTNALHIRAFEKCVIWLDELVFSEPIAPIDATSVETIVSGFTVPETGKPGDLPIRQYLGITASATEEIAFLWDNFDDRDPNNKPELAPNGVNIWWDNWANLRAKNEDGAIRIDYRPKKFDPEDYETEDDYYAHAADWMGNFGEAIDMWALEGISYCKYLVIRVKGEAGGEENKLIMDWHPEDSKFYAARFSDLVLKDGSHPHITTEWQDLVIDLEASGFPGMTNAFHIRAFDKCVISIDEIGFAAPLELIDKANITGGMTVPETGKPGDLPIKKFISELGN